MRSVQEGTSASEDEFEGPASFDASPPDAPSGLVCGVADLSRSWPRCCARMAACSSFWKG